jgi:hypothetical protein
MSTDNLISSKDAGEKNYASLRREKEARKTSPINSDEISIYYNETRGIKTSFYDPSTGESTDVPIEDELYLKQPIEEKRMVNKNPRMFIEYKKSRCENKTPKCRRDHSGINRGNPGGCKYCNRDIFKRMGDTVEIRSYMRTVKKDGFDYDL